MKKAEAKVLPFCKGELEGISYTVLAQLGYDIEDSSEIRHIFNPRAGILIEKGG